MRTSKTVDGVKHTYIYASGKLLRETYGDTTIDFFYDVNGNAYALKYNDTVYYYITNLQGDVMSIVDAQGTVVASYEYDPYGNVITATGDLAEINPLRYRGYYFDSETGMYYLQSRYYDPEIGRFINADNYASTGRGLLGNNMFAYCNNNPINFTDSFGSYPRKAVTVTSIDPEGNSPWISPPDTSHYEPFGTVGQFIKSEVDSSITFLKSNIKELWELRYDIIDIEDLDDVSSVGSKVMGNELVKQGQPWVQVGIGTYNIVSGILLIVAPIPGPHNELTGARKIVVGFNSIVTGIGTLTGWSEDKR